MIELQRLGFRYFALCSHVDPERRPKGAIILHNYPAAWAERHRRLKYSRRDPVFLRAREQSLAFLWEDPAFLALLDPDQRAILDDAAAHGLKHGATIPLHGPHRYSASCSVVAETGLLSTELVHQATWFAAYAYDAGRRIAGPMDKRPRHRLPRRERQTLELVALGKSDEEIGAILGIDAATAHGYIESAKRRLNATKRTHAVAYAIYTEAINLEDVFGA
jgi:LuxR family quorum-sensing system transcriptional regulator CciR